VHLIELSPSHSSLGSPRYHLSPGKGNVRIVIVHLIMIVHLVTIILLSVAVYMWPGDTKRSIRHGKMGDVRLTDSSSVDI